LREAARIKEEESEAELKEEEEAEGIPRNAMERMEASFRFVKRHWER